MRLIYISAVFKGITTGRKEVSSILEHESFKKTSDILHSSLVRHFNDHAPKWKREEIQ